MSPSAQDVVKSKTPILITKEEPTYLNSGIFTGAGKWALIYMPVAALLGINPEITPDLAKAGIWTSMIAGGVVGSMREKSEMENHLHHGKKLKNPGFWNKHIFTGIGVGLALAAAVQVVLSMFGVAASAFQGLGTMGLVMGGTFGGIIGKELMRSDVKEAERQRQRALHDLAHPISVPSPAMGVAASRTVFTQPEVIRPVGFKNTLSSEESGALEARLKQQNEAAAFAAQLEATRHTTMAEKSV